MSWISRHKKLIYLLAALILFLLFSIALNSYLLETQNKSTSALPPVPELAIPQNVDTKILNSVAVKTCLAPTIAQHPAPLPSVPSSSAATSETAAYVSRVRANYLEGINWMQDLHTSTQKCYNQQISQQYSDGAPTKVWK
ncbi:MAG TPA: hypothetical protein VGE59_00315 [Patescibacteria group bacterium]